MPHKFSESGNLSGFATEHAAAVLVIGSLVALILIKRGFRGVSVMGASVSVK